MKRWPKLEPFEASDDQIRLISKIAAFFCERGFRAFEVVPELRRNEHERLLLLPEASVTAYLLRFTPSGRVSVRPFGTRNGSQKIREFLKKYFSGQVIFGPSLPRPSRSAPDAKATPDWQDAMTEEGKAAWRDLGYKKLYTDENSKAPRW